MNRMTRRRRFLKHAAYAGAGIAASTVFALPGYSQARGRTATARLGLVAPREDFNRRLFGAFLEQSLDTCVCLLDVHAGREHAREQIRVLLASAQFAMDDL